MSGLQDLTKHLLELRPDALTAATEHPMLKAAGAGVLPVRKLREWLAQDVHYTRGYVRFVGGLLSRLKLEWAVSEDQQLTMQHRIFDLLTDALVNIRREMSFFQDIDEQYGLGVTSQGKAKQTRAARGYIELFEQWSTHGSGTHHWQAQNMDFDGPDEQLLYGLVCLWATEMCYLRAWSYAARVMRGEEPSSSEKSKGSTESSEAEDTAAATGALHQHLIPNWSSPEFRDFVQRCADVTDSVGRNVDGALSKSSDAKRTVVLENCRSVYLSILELEQAFWPSSRRYSSTGLTV